MELKRGVLRAFDSSSYTATVAIDGSIATYLDAVPVARNITSVEMMAGRSVAVLFFDVANPESAVVLAVWE